MRLQFFGILLSFESVLLVIFWKTKMPLNEILAHDSVAWCWPPLESCEGLHRFAVNFWPWLLLLILISGLGAAWAFWRNRTQWGKALLLIMLLIKNVVIFSDLRLGGNYHSLISIVGLIYILIPSPQQIILVMIALFYFVAGLLKFNLDWLSGALISATWVPEILRPGAAVFAIFLELFIVFGLFSHRSLIFYFVFSLFLLFHIISIPSVGFLYPSIMVILLTAFPLFRKTALPVRWSESRFRLLIPALFLLFQIPNFTARGDNGLTGENRNWSLIMYDAATTCDVQIPWRSGQRSGLLVKSDFKLQPRVHCDPLHYATFIRGFCRKLMADDGQQAQVGLNLVTRRVTDKQRMHLVQQTDLCRPEFKIQSIGQNTWIRTERRLSLEDPITFINLNQNSTLPYTISTESRLEITPGKIQLRNLDQETWSFEYPSGGIIQLIESNQDLFIFSTQLGRRWLGLRPYDGQLLWTLSIENLVTAQKKEPGLWEFKTDLPFAGVQRVQIIDSQPVVSPWVPVLSQ